MDPTQNWLFSLCHISQAEIHLSTLARGERTSDQLDGKPQVALVCDGSIRVSSGVATGGALLINQVGKGGLFGDSNLFLEASLPTTIQARSKTTLALVDKKLVKMRLLEEPKAMEAYARFCNEKLQFLLGRLNSLSDPSAHRRLCLYIQDHQSQGKVVLRNKQALSSVLGMSRATLFRELSSLEKEGILKQESLKTYAADTAALQTYLEESTT